MHRPWVNAAKAAVRALNKAADHQQSLYRDGPAVERPEQSSAPTKASLAQALAQCDSRSSPNTPMNTELATPRATAPTLSWSEELQLGMPIIDQTHQEFVELLAAVELADDDQLLARLEALQTHTVAHFGMEDQWMKSTQFGPQHCHSGQHELVLRMLQEMLRCGREDGDLQLVRSVLPDLGRWFSQHAQTMDAMLTWHLGQIGFNPETGEFTLPPAQEGAADNACGSGCAS